MSRVSFQWQINGKILLFVVLFLPITLGLGLWQLERADEKREILAEQSARAAQVPLGNSALDEASTLHLRPFSLQLEFDPQRWFLLDNRVRHARPGYEVLNIARLAGSNELVLVNRGWVPASLDRSELPDLPIPEGLQDIEGYFYAPDERAFQLGQQSWSGNWPERVQYVDLEVLADRLEEELLPAELRLAPADPLAFEAQWQLVNQEPQMHLGYAVQWFAMAAALLLLGLFANSNLAQLIKFKRRESH